MRKDRTMAATQLPSQERLHKLLDCQPEIGLLIWRERPQEMFSSKRGHSIWNARFAGKPVFGGDNGRGYKQSRIDGRDYLVHRLVWKWVHGADPICIDHINGDVSDNRISNLRNVTHLENMHNKKRSKNNSSGVTGVTWDNARGVWRAGIMINGKSKYLGRFTNLEKATTLRKDAEAQGNYHINHGR
jgi:hypothetical protein